MTGPAPGFDRIAEALAHKAALWRDWDDLEALARLPAGEIVIDAREGRARHAAAGPIALRLAVELQAALGERLAMKGLGGDAVQAAEVTLRATPGGVRTDPARIVHFDFDLGVRLSAGGREHRASRREEHVWHSRARG